MNKRKFIKFIATVTIIALSSCAQTPEAIKGLGVKATYNFDADIKTAAECTLKSYDELFVSLIVQERIIDDQINIYLRSPGATVSVLTFIANSKPTTANLYVTNGSLAHDGWVKHTTNAVAKCGGKKIS